MRERERLEDFKGGHIACRVCRRLLFFDPVALKADTALPRLCCGIAYVPERTRIDVVIYDRLASGEFPGAEMLAPPVPIEIAADAYVSEDASSRTGPDETVEINEGEIDSMLVTADTAAERFPERVAALKRRGPQYGD